MLPTICVIGPPLSGTSTLASALGAHVDFAHFDVGALLENAGALVADAPIGSVDPAVCLAVIETAKRQMMLTAPPELLQACEGIVLDGFPASQAQLLAFLDVNPPPLAVF